MSNPDLSTAVVLCGRGDVNTCAWRLTICNYKSVEYNFYRVVRWWWACAWVPNSSKINQNLIKLFPIIIIYLKFSWLSSLKKSLSVWYLRWAEVRDHNRCGRSAQVIIRSDRDHWPAKLSIHKWSVFGCVELN